MQEATNRARWLVVLGSTIALMFSNGPVVLFTFGVFLKPVSEEFGWSRGTMSLGLTIGLILGGLVTPLVGMWIDRWSIRRVTLIFITLFALSFAALSIVPSSVTVFIVMYALAGLIAGGQAPLPYAKAISGWFEDKRGLALGIAMAGVGVGIAIVPQLAQALMNNFGWRNTYALLGAITWVIAFPTVLFFIKDPIIGGNANKSTSAAQADTTKDPFHAKDFWLITVSVFLVVAAVNGIVAHMIALLTDRGVPADVATKMLAAVGLATIGGRLLSGYLLDRIFAPYLAAVVFLIPLVGVGILLSGPVSIPLVMVAAISLGLGLGAEVDIIGFLTGRYFGLRRYGEIYGYIFALFTIGSGVGPLIMGSSFDKTGSYTTALLVFGAALVVASILIALLGPYRFAQANDRPLGSPVSKNQSTARA